MTKHPLLVEAHYRKRLTELLQGRDWVFIENLFAFERYRHQTKAGHYLIVYADNPPCIELLDASNVMAICYMPNMFKQREDGILVKPLFGFSSELDVVNSPQWALAYSELEQVHESACSISRVL